MRYQRCFNTERKNPATVGLCFSLRIPHFIHYMRWLDRLLYLQVSSSRAEKGPTLPCNKVRHLTKSTEGPGSQGTPRISQWSGPMSPILFSRKPWSGLDPTSHQHAFSPSPTCPTQLRTCMVLLSSSGPGNNIPENLLIKWSSSFRT